MAPARLEGNEPEPLTPFLDLPLDPAAIWAWAVASRGDTLRLEGMGAMAIRTVLTYEDYAALPADGRRYEIHEGALSVTPAPGTRHQEVKANLFDVLRHHVKERSLGKLFDAPTDCILAEATIVQPDIGFVGTGRITIISERGIEGIPNLVVEVLSPSTAQLDRGPKAQLYARHLVPSYWIVDPGRRTIDAYALVEGTYRLAARLDGNEPEALPPVLDLPLDPAAIWV
jgi:Uma2 family endonuclease